ncbi:MAG: hypothetical protein A2W18_08670 [Candidatus Muproteobacteria bacterium RBG_16_60_9]|uniref:Type II secretion system protein K n=1 Tax=Candidatus Muproteobacteria bacterium RBG_16_60_9 TaxID=1817755 RepID=A0A1F6VH68_9PROT|nr:MAG: hypothetical protein A2W18_08670 [Candidatus Muproteobacteria bacterium RBG_16_60_9]
MKSYQQGVALITAMLIMAIIATLATSLALGQQVWLRQTQNLADLAQAERVRHGAYEYAAAVLVRDAKNANTNKTDHLQEPWSQPISLPVDGGVVFIKIDDAQARFNLNNLVQQGQSVPDEADIYRRLLAPFAPPTDLVNPLLDWIDEKPDTLAGGAEDLDYLNLDLPYRTANQPLRSVNELRLVKGYTEKMVEDLRPHVEVLPPTANRTKINVNTADKAVLDALIGTDSTLAIEARARNPFETAQDFQRLFPGAQLKQNTYDVRSDFFIVTVIARIGRIERRTEALIKRSSGSNASASVLWYRQPSIQIVIDEDKS